jgi:FHA domain
MSSETGSDQPASDVASAIPATFVLAPDHAPEQSTSVYDWLMVGRECAGVEEKHRLLIDDPAVSRTHLELRLDLELDQAWLTDHSTNGTRLNGQRIERSVPVRIKPGDRVRLGGAELQFRSRRFAAAAGVALGPAAVSQLTGMLVTVLGDATNVAFRLSGLAGRDDRPGVLVTDAVYHATSAAFAFTPPSAIQVKGRSQPVQVLGASGL